MKKTRAKSLDDAAGEFQERGSQRNAFAHRSQQNVEESRGGNLACHLDEIDSEAQLKHTFVRQYVCRRCRSVSEVDESFAHESLREDAAEYRKKKKEAGHPGQETRRSFCDVLCHGFLMKS